jgi:hypothetical protein
MVRFLIPGGTGNWNSTTNWSTTSGGASGASFPVAGDDVIFDINSLNANITINVASACATLTCSSYTGNLTFTNTLSTTGNLVFSTGMTTSGSGSLSVGTNTFSITSNGVYLRNFTGSGSPTITLNDNCYVINLSKTGASGTFTINGLFNLSVSGNLAVGTNTFMTGTATMILTSNCTISGGGRLRMNLTINSSGTVTFPTSYIFDGSGYIVTYTAGIVIPPTTTYISASRTFDVAGIVWSTIICDTNATITLLSKLTATTITIDTTLIFKGSAGWECNIFNLGTTANTGRTITLEDGVTYRVNNDFNSIRSTNSNRAILQSSSGTIMTYFTCGAGCVMNVGYTNAIRIDSSLGKQVYSFNGIYTTAINWSNTFPVSVCYAGQN